MMKIGIIIGSTRPGRNGESVGKWVYELAKKRTDAQFELIDLVDYNLPLLDEPYPASMMKYTKEHTKKWSEKVDQFDGFVIVTPEYNHSIPGALKNAIDFLAKEWCNKAVGFVSYGSAGGVRAVEHLRSVAGQMQMADVQAQVILSLFTDFVNMSEFKPNERNEGSLNNMLDQVILWSTALKSIRQ